jgi:hypothetical protein
LIAIRKRILLTKNVTIAAFDKRKWYKEFIVNNIMNVPQIPYEGFVPIEVTQDLYKINTFDDGNQKLESKENKYYKIGYYERHPEKIALLHVDKSTIVPSISSWKVSLLNNHWMSSEISQYDKKI